MTGKTTPNLIVPPLPYSPQFEGAPGEWVATGRALWEVAKWLLFRCDTYHFLPMIFFLIMPGGSNGLFSGGFVSILYGVSLLGRLSTTQTVIGLSTLPIPSTQWTRLLWAMSVVLYPLLYGAIQLPIRTIALVAGEGSWSWIGLILPECIIAMGLAAPLSLGLAASSGEVPYGTQRQSQWTIAGFMITAAFLGVFGVGWVMRGAEGLGDPVYATLVCISAALVAISYRFADRAVGLDALARRKGAGASPSLDVRLFGFNRSGPATFWGLWLSQFNNGIGIVFATGVGIGMMAILSPFDDTLMSSSAPYVMSVVLLIICARYQQEIDFRVLRCLPLRTSHQALLVLTFVFPLILPLGIAALCVAPYMGWPLIDALGFVVALGGCCALALAVGSVYGYLFSGVLAAIPAIPIIAILLHWHSPRALLVFGGLSAVLWLFSYSYLYKNLGGDGAVYRKREDNKDWDLWESPIFGKTR
ncbi:MAG: hypothetical protein IT365_08395 [Candidatus Hydrogenedentes bacterium]|nr:hypothetical protein [Candidatus Hydrogenedentota bacterium]